MGTMILPSRALRKLAHCFRKLTAPFIALDLGLWHVSFEVISPRRTTWQLWAQSGIQVAGKTGAGLVQH